MGGDEVDDHNTFTYMENGILKEKAHIIFATSNLKEIKKYLPEDTVYYKGDMKKKECLEEWLGSFDGTWASFIHKNETK